VRVSKDSSDASSKACGLVAQTKAG
jgi:hypothetical protein